MAQRRASQSASGCGRQLEAVAAWLSRHRRMWTRNGALAMMCLASVRGVERAEDDVLVLSIDRLTHILRVAAGTGRNPPSSG